MQEKEFWLILASSVVLLSVICIALVGFIYFVVIPRPVISSATPLVMSTSASPTRTPQSTAPAISYPTIALRTPLAEPSLTPTPTTIPSGVTPSRASPEEFIRSYYSLINQREYTTTFEMLSDGFKDRRHCCNPDGSYQFEPYADWWDSVARVQIISVDTERWEQDTARVVIQIRYIMKDGRVVNSTHTFNLIADPSSDSWLIDQ